MSTPQEFLKNAEAALNLRVGGIVARALLKTNLAKMNKDAANLTTEDLKVLTENIVSSASLFETRGEAKLIASDLEALVKAAE